MKHYPEEKRYSAFDPTRSEDPFANFFRSFFGERPMTSLMNTDIYESDGNYNLDIDMPGFDKSEINVELSDGNLTISARHSEKEETEGYVRRERSGSCTRSFYVGKADAAAISAAYDKGILHVVVPKEKPETSGKRIDIK